MALNRTPTFIRLPSCMFQHCVPNDPNAVRRARREKRLGCIPSNFFTLFLLTSTAFKQLQQLHDMKSLPAWLLMDIHKLEELFCYYDGVE